MRNRIIALVSIAITLFVTIGCNTGSNTGPSEQTANKYVGTWVAIHVYTSGYTDPVYMPVAAKKQTNTLKIMNDGTYTESIQLVLVDNSTQSGTYTGFYTSTDNSVTFIEKSGTIEGSPVSEQDLGQNVYQLSGTNTLEETDSNSAESPEEDASGNPLYPIVLTYQRQ